jgi:hypothetical protein
MFVAFIQDWEVSKIEGALMLQELVTSILSLLGFPLVTSLIEPETDTNVS